MGRRRAALLLTQCHRWNRQPQQKHYPLLQHLFIHENLTHNASWPSKLLTATLFPETPPFLRSCGFRTLLPSTCAIKGRNLRSTRVAGVNFQARRKACRTGSQIAIRRRRPPTPSGEKTLSEVGSSCNHSLGSWAGSRNRLSMRRCSCGDNRLGRRPSKARQPAPQNH
jgi:hypothetical protein